MSTYFEVETSTGRYSVDIRRGAFKKRALADYQNELILTDERFASVCAAEVNGRTIAIKAEERTKSLDSIPDIILEMRRLGANRRTSLVAVGGGVVRMWRVLPHPSICVGSSGHMFPRLCFQCAIRASAAKVQLMSVRTKTSQVPSILRESNHRSGVDLQS